MIFETHAHYNDERFDDDRETLLSSMKEKGVGTIVNVGADMQGSLASIELAKKYPFMYAAVGIHPSDCGQMNQNDLKSLEDMAQYEKVVAIGEIGLDYYWPEPDRLIQKEWFVKQLELAKKLHKPVIIHSRDAAKDTMDILKEYVERLNNVVIHCFSYSVEMAMEYIKMDFYIGVGGVLTFKNGKKLQEVVENVPIEKILLETDCPYMAPEPHRGTRNDSSYIIYVANKLAQIKNMDVKEVIRQTELNACKFYGVEPGNCEKLL